MSSRIACILLIFSLVGCVAPTSRTPNEPAAAGRLKPSNLGVLMVPWDQQNFFPAVEVCYKKTSVPLMSPRHSSCMAKILEIGLNKYEISAQKYVTHGDRVHGFCSKKLSEDIDNSKTASGMPNLSKLTKRQLDCLSQTFVVQQELESVPAKQRAPQAVTANPAPPGYMMNRASSDYQNIMAGVYANPGNVFLEQQARAREEQQARAQEERLRASDRNMRCTSRWINNQLYTQCN